MSSARRLSSPGFDEETRTYLQERVRLLAGAVTLITGVLAGAFLLIPFGLFIGAIRWRWLLAANGVHASIPFLMISSLVRRFLQMPGKLPFLQSLHVLRLMNLAFR